MLAGDDGEIRDDGLRVEGELGEDVLVAPDYVIGDEDRLLAGGLPEFLLPIPEHGAEPLRDRGRHRPLRRRPRGPRVLPRGREPLLHGRAGVAAPRPAPRARWIGFLLRVRVWIERSHRGE